MSAGVLVVGGGQAGVELVCSLRERGYTAPITIVGEEPYLPYQRPPLSKAYLAGKANAETLALRSDDFFEREKITILKGQRVVEVTAPSRDGNLVGIAKTDKGITLEFDKLVLAVGAGPRKLQIPGHELSGIHYLRDIADAEALKGGLGEANSVVVIGGGFIGLEAAAVARARGKTVTVLQSDERLMSRVVAPVVSQFYLDAHRRRGSRIQLNSVAAGFVGRNGRVEGVILADGSQLAADIVIVGVGVIPRLELAQQLGLECGTGICVDEFARTSHPSVFAIGDCTMTPHPLVPGKLIQLESVPHAQEQAKIAAAAIVGQPEAYKAVPWFWSDQDTLKLQIVGLSSGFDQTVVKGNPDAEKFAVYYFREGQLLAVDAINSPRDFMAGRRALSSGVNIAPADIS